MQEDAAHPEMALPQLLSRAVQQLDAQFTHTAKRTADSSGCTAVLLCLDAVRAEAHYCWAGDSAVWMYNAAAPPAGGAVLLTPPHKPDRPDETARIEALGGTVVKPFGSTVYRVEGILAVSRAVGDKNLKPMVTAEPEYGTVGAASASASAEQSTAGATSADLSDPNLLFFLGSDGLFDAFDSSSGGVAGAMAAAVGQSGLDNMHGIAACMVLQALEAGSRDNITCIVVRPFALLS